MFASVSPLCSSSERHVKVIELSMRLLYMLTAISVSESLVNNMLSEGQINIEELL